MGKILSMSRGKQLDKSNKAYELNGPGLGGMYFVHIKLRTNSLMRPF